MSGIWRLPGDSRFPFGFTDEFAGRFEWVWRRFAAGLQVAPRELKARATAPVFDDDGVFALQCAESKARMEFDEAMQVWASRTQPEGTDASRANQAPATRGD
jgi:hypothetical protein